LLKTINELTGNTFQENSLLLEPNFVASTEQNNRPELKFFDLQKEKIQVLTAVTQAKRMPKIAAFAQAGYGKPALNMFKDSFEPYYIVGARLTWNIWDWNTTRNDKQILSIQSQLVDTQKEIFSKNITIGLEKEKANLDKYKESLQKDLEIIELRTKIVRVYASQLENGTLKSSDYISELNNLTQAQLTKELHQIQLLQAQANYNQYLGN